MCVCVCVCVCACVCLCVVCVCRVLTLPESRVWNLSGMFRRPTSDSGNYVWSGGGGIQTMVDRHVRTERPFTSNLLSASLVQKWCKSDVIQVLVRCTKPQSTSSEFLVVVGAQLLRSTGTEPIVFV